MTTRLTRTTLAPAVSAVRITRIDDHRVDRSFRSSFCIGRDEACDVRFESGMASRRHAEVVFESGAWRLRDLESTNGTYLDGARVEEAALRGRHVVRLGVDGPEVELSVEKRPDLPAAGRAITTPGGLTTTPIAEAGSAQPPASDSVTGYVQRYFTDTGDDGGAHTQMIRQAYRRVSEANRRKYTRLLYAAGALVLLAVIYAGVAQYRMSRLEARAAEAFQTMKQLDVQMAKLQAYIEEREDVSLSDQLTDLTSLRQRTRARYEGYVEELGLRRRLTDEERVIYRVARIFNESEFEMPAMFVRAVRQTINDYWLSPAGRARFQNAIRRAEENGYTREIVRAMWQRGLPPEFFYLGLQESNFEPGAVGPRTRWGIAKGMWQFIPETARAYGLVTGPREDQRVYDPQDQRHEVPAATDAAARYLLEIYGQLAQASGLLAMASYNWGERRVVGRLQELLEGIPDDPEARSYWRFLTEYSDRMPDETKDYVLKIVAAAVIGQDPRLFGFDFENPLQRYIEEEAARES